MVEGVRFGTDDLRVMSEQTLSLDDSMALTVLRPPKPRPKRRVLDASWTPVAKTKCNQTYGKLREFWHGLYSSARHPLQVDILSGGP